MSGIVVIGGETAVGKSDFACKLAKRINGEIISADSMCVYKEMNIGNAKPLGCMKEVKHYLVGVVSALDYFDAKIFTELAKKSYEEILKKGKVPLLVGGSYLYIKAFLYGLAQTPKPDWKLRKRLYSVAQRKGNEYLYKVLRAIDKEYAKKISPRDLRRIVRALEVFINSGRRFSSFHNWNKPLYPYVGIYLTREKEDLKRRIEDRLKGMLRDGLLRELEELMNMGFERVLTSPQAINYKEFIPYLKGEKGFLECYREAVKNTIEYAKRQRRWFSKQNWHRINLSEVSEEEALEEVIGIVRRFIRPE